MTTQDINDQVRQQNIRNEAMRSAEKQKSSGVKFILIGVVLIVLWCIAYFTPAIWTNYVFIIIAGPLCVVVGVYQVYSGSKKLAALR